MPYVDPDTRDRVDADLRLDCVSLAGYTVGMLNYVVTRLLDRWLGERPNYERLSAAVSVLECAKLELYRRVAVPYEEVKCHDNGDVYRPRYYPTCQKANAGSSCSQGVCVSPSIATPAIGSPEARVPGQPA